MADPSAGGRGAPPTAVQTGTAMPPANQTFGPSPTPASTPAQPRPTPPPSSTSRYMPQFSAATQMMINRMKKSQSTSGPSTSGGATSPQLSIKPEFSPSSYEDARKKVIMGMKTMGSTTLQMPSPAPRATPQPLAPRTLAMPSGSLPSSFNYRSSTPMVSKPSVSTSTQPVPVTQVNRIDNRGKIATGAKGMSAIRRVTMGLTASGRPVAPTSAQPKSTPGPELKEKKAKPPPYTGPKRKPGRPRRNQQTADNSASEASDVSDAESPTRETTATPTTTTKSGRQILKPTTYNPAAMDSAGKKRQYSKVRTTEQALCKLCTRMASPDWNQIVFCDGCNDGWHQQCHTPWIPSDVIGEGSGFSKTWYCMHCTAKRDHHQQPASKKQRIVSTPVTVPTKVSWASHPLQQKRTYLSTLPQQELVALVMGALEIHPDLPIFPGEQRTVTTPAKKSAMVTLLVPSTQQQQQQNGDGEEEEDDELTKAWPKPGAGPFNAQLAVFMAANKDAQDDFRAISHTLYREGRKVWENGIAV